MVCVCIVGAGLVVVVMMVRCGFFLGCITCGIWLGGGHGFSISPPPPSPRPCFRHSDDKRRTVVALHHSKNDTALLFKVVSLENVGSNLEGVLERGRRRGGGGAVPYTGL